MALCLQHRCPFPAAGAGLDYGLCERHGTVERNRRLAERDVQERAREEATLRRAAAPQRPTTTLPPSPPRFVVGEPKRLAPPPIHHKPPVPKARRVDSGSAGLPVRPPPVDAESTPTPDAAPEAEEIPMPELSLSLSHDVRPVTTLSETLQATLLALAAYFDGPGVDKVGSWRNTLSADLGISPHAAYQRLTRLETEACITDAGQGRDELKRLECIRITAVGWATAEHLTGSQAAEESDAVDNEEEDTDDDTTLEEPLELERTPFGSEEGLDNDCDGDDPDALARLVYSASLENDASVSWEQTHPDIRSACRRSAEAVREAVLAQEAEPVDSAALRTLATLALGKGYTVEETPEGWVVQADGQEDQHFPSLERVVGFLVHEVKKQALCLATKDLADLLWGDPAVVRVGPDLWQVEMDGELLTPSQTLLDLHNSLYKQLRTKLTAATTAEEEANAYRAATETVAQVLQCPLSVPPEEVATAAVEAVRERDSAAGDLVSLLARVACMAKELGLHGCAQPYEVANAVADLVKAHRTAVEQRDVANTSLAQALERSATTGNALRGTERQLREALGHVDRLEEANRYALTAGQVDSLRRGARFLEDSDDIGVSYVDGLLTMLLATLPEPATDAVKAAK